MDCLNVEDDKETVICRTLSDWIHAPPHSMVTQRHASERV